MLNKPCQFSCILNLICTDIAVAKLCHILIFDHLRLLKFCISIYLSNSIYILALFLCRYWNINHEHSG